MTKKGKREIEEYMARSDLPEALKAANREFVGAPDAFMAVETLEQHDEDQDQEQIYNLDELDDLRLAIELLSGKIEHTEERISGSVRVSTNPQKKYLSGSGEIVGRKALSRLLRNSKPLDDSLRRQLAALFDPETEQPPFSSFDCAPIERRLIFESRHRGARTESSLRKITIAADYLNRVRLVRPKEARLATAKFYRVSERWVEMCVAHLKALTK